VDLWAGEFGSRGQSQNTAPVEAGAEGCEDDRPGGGGVGGVPLRGRDEEGGGGGVAVAVDVAEEALFGDGEGEGDLADEVEVGLMHEVSAYVGGLQVVFGEEVFDGAGDLARGLQDDGETLHLDGAAVGELEGVGEVAVGGEGDVGDLCEAVAGCDDAGSGSVAEEDGGVGVGVGDAAGHDLGGDDEDVAVAGGEVGSEGEGDEGAGAGYGNVDGRGGGEAEFRGEDGGWAGEGALGGAAGEEDEADVGGGEGDFFEAGPGGGEAKVGDGGALWGVTSFVDAAGLLHGGGVATGACFECVVGHDSVGEVVTEGAEVGHDFRLLAPEAAETGLDRGDGSGGGPAASEAVWMAGAFLLIARLLPL